MIYLYQLLLFLNSLRLKKKFIFFNYFLLSPPINLFISYNTIDHYFAHSCRKISIMCFKHIQCYQVAHQCYHYVLQTHSMLPSCTSMMIYLRLIFLNRFDILPISWLSFLLNLYFFPFKASVTKPMFTSWLVSNGQFEEAKHLTYAQFVSKFFYEKKKRTWKL